MTHGSLFSGIGGFDLASNWMGWENKFHCEIDEFCKQVLKYYWPNADSYNDITKTDFTIWRGRIDVLTGGFPCQPFSVAGERKGTEDSRHLWPEMLRAIREIQPKWIVGENVHGIINWNRGLVFEQVCTDLETEGYEVQPVILPACSVNAPHKRERVWFVAYNSNARAKGLQQEKANGIYGSESIANPNGIRLQARLKRGKQKHNKEKRKRIYNSFKRFVNNGIIANTRLFGQEERQKQPMGIEQLCEKRNDTNTKRSRRTQDNKQFTSNEFKYVGSSWDNFPTQSPICFRDDGISTKLDRITFPKWRSESIKAAGNAIVPQVVYQIFKVIELMENQTA